MITNPGIFNLTMAEYLKDPCIVPSLNAGTISCILSQSPAHAWAQHPRLNPNYQEEHEERFDLGSAAHALLLEGEDRMQLIRADSYRTKAAQEARDAARAEGKYPILEARYHDVFAMREIALQKIANCPDLSGVKLDRDGVAESVVIWQEGETMMRCRPDWMAHDAGITINYKTTDASSSPASWPRTMLGTGADIQAAFEARGVLAVTKKQARVIFLVQEVYAPFACSLIALSPEFREFADSKIDCGIEVWRECMKANAWPAYQDRIAYVDPPAWAITQHEELMESGVVIPNAKARRLETDPAV